MTNAIEFSPKKLIGLMLVDFFIGFIWHSGFMFEKAWLKIIGVSKEKLDARMKEQGMAKLMIVQILFNVIAELSHAFLLIQINPASRVEALLISFIVWLGFTAGPAFGPVIWESKSIKYFFITSGWRLLSMVIFSTLYVPLDIPIF